MSEPRPDVVIRRIGQCLVVGCELRERLERLAAAEGRDGTSLAKAVLRDYVEQAEKGIHDGTRT
jgi:hypothetical protein